MTGGNIEMKKETCFAFIYVSVIVCTLTFNVSANSASADANDSFVQSQPAQMAAEETPTVDTDNIDPIELAKEQLRGDFYKEGIDSLKWSLGIIVGLVVLIIGYIRWSNKKEYKEAVAEAKEASKDASNMREKAASSCEKAREYEQKAQEQLTSIETTVEAKLKEIEDQAKTILSQIEKQGKEQREKSINEAERQRKINELWNKAIESAKQEDYQLEADYWRQIVEELKVEDYLVYNNWGATLGNWAKLQEGDKAGKLFNQACEKLKKAVDIKPDFHMAYRNWGAALCGFAKLKESDDADNLFSQACEKFQKAVNIKPDYHEAYNNWGAALLFWSIQKEGIEREEKLKLAEEKLLKAESKETGSGAYNLACLYGLRSDKEKCRQWLETAEKARTLISRKKAMEDEDLEIVKQEEWFKNLSFKGE